MQGFNRFDKILYINLAHREDRNRQILTELDRLGVDPEKIVRIDAVYKPLNGHYGCTLSHLKAFQYAVDHDLGDVLILEDDMQIQGDATDLDEIFSHFLERAPEWDVFFFGGNVKTYQRTPQPRIFRAISVSMCHAYGVKSHYLKTLLQFFKEAEERLRTIPLRQDTEHVAHDKLWDVLMPHAGWFFVEMIAFQRPSFSDTYIAHHANKLRRYFTQHDLYGPQVGDICTSHGDPNSSTPPE